MSKIGRRPIELNSVNIEVKDGDVHYKGPKAFGVHTVPALLNVIVENKELKLVCDAPSSENNRIWGLHRALLANKIKGAQDGFVLQLKIEGLGYKAAVSGNKIVFSLGYSHKIDFDIPEGITVEADRTGQLLTIKGTSKELVGHVASKIRMLRPPEPYKGTGIRLLNEVIQRKAGKAKSA